jgi:hypothetical protein
MPHPPSLKISTGMWNDYHKAKQRKNAKYTWPLGNNYPILFIGISIKGPI